LRALKNRRRGTVVESRERRKTVPGWPGYVRRQRNGTWVFIIERMMRGRRFHVSTGATTITAARAQLERFQADPTNYDPRGSEAAGTLRLTDELIAEWEAFSLAKGNGGPYTRDHGRKLLMWALRLNGADLRKLTLQRLRACLEGLGARKHRIIALKSFFTWLRTEKGLLTTAQDATLDLPVPQSSPEKHRRRKVVAWQLVERLLAHWSERAEAERWCPRRRDDRLQPGDDAQRRRDCLLLLTATGWHVTELLRFIRGGEVVRQAKGDAQAVLVVRHKGGELTRTPVVHREHLDAAERLRAAGHAPRNIEKKHRAACVAAGVPPFGLGVMRHSVATWAHEAGAAPELIAQFLGHKDARTTKRFYIDLAVPTNVIPLRRVH
jgi:integrase